MEPSVKGEFQKQDELRVTIRLSDSPSHYHLIEVIQTGRLSACLQISHECDKMTVCDFARHIKGLGTI